MTEVTNPKSYKYVWLQRVMASQAKCKTKNVAYVLFQKASAQGEAWPNFTTIDLELGGVGHGKNVGRQIQELHELGYLKTIQKMRVTQGYSNRYKLVLPDHPLESTHLQADATNHQGDSESHQIDGLST